MALFQRGTLFGGYTEPPTVTEVELWFEDFIQPDVSSAPSGFTVTIPSCTSRVLSWTPLLDVGAENMIPIDTWPDSSIEPYVVPIVPGQRYQLSCGANEVATIHEGEEQTPRVIGNDESAVFTAVYPAVLFSWEPFEPVTATLKRSADVAAHRIYRDDVVLTEVAADVYTYTDTVTITAPHKYEVCSLDASGGESERSTWNDTSIWQQSFGNQFGEVIRAACVDDDDNFIVVGDFRGTLNLGAGEMTSSVTAPFVAKFNSLGVCQWSKAVASDAGSILLCVTADSSGNVFVGGQGTTNVSFGGDTFNKSASNGADAIIAKYNSSGVHQWSKMFGMEVFNHSKTNKITSLDVDSSGNVYIGGNYYGVISFDGGSTSLGNFFGGPLYALCKFTAAGSFSWHKQLQSAGDANVVSCRVDASDNLLIMVIGGGGGNVYNFGGSDLTQSSGAIVMAKYNASGTHQWSVIYTVEFPAAQGISGKMDLDSSGNPVVVFEYNGFGGDAGGGALPVLSGFYSHDNFCVARYSGTDGSFVTSSVFCNVTSDNQLAASDIKVSPDGTIYICGTMQVDLRFEGTDTRLAGIASIGGYLLKFNSACVFQWGERLEGEGGGDFGRGLTDRAAALAIDSDGKILVGGDFSSQRIILGWQTLTNPYADQYVGTTEAYLYKRYPCP